MNHIFKLCVQFLENLASKLGITYEEINVWIFVIIEPIVFILLLWIIRKQYVALKAYKKVNSIQTGPKLKPL